MRLFKKTLFYATFLTGIYSTANAYVVNPAEIYTQAQQNNVEYFQQLKRYKGAVDIADRNGDTAFCMALRAKDYKTLQVLRANGANMSQKCRMTQKRQTSSSREKKSDSFDIDKNYLYAGAGLAAIGGGIALAASSGGGSSHKGGDAVSEPVGDVVSSPADEFKTDEYYKGNFLDAINAAEAYSHIYKKDENGNYFGYQADSDERLKKIKVGVLDVGTINNQDLAGTITKGYDGNQYNDESSVFGYVTNGGDQGYVVKKGKDYYLFHIHKTEDGNYVEIWSNGTEGNLIFSEADMRKAVAQEWGVQFEDFTLMNGGAVNAPGVDVNGRFITDSSNSDFWKSWAEVVMELSHGTHIAGIIGANKNDSGMHGVAFDNAEILSASWDLDSSNARSLIKQMVDDGATVLNNSWGVGVDDIFNAKNAELLKLYDTDILHAYAYAAQKGAVWVQATGNDGQREGSIHLGMPTLDLSSYGYKGPKEYEAPFLAVTALDTTKADANAPAGKLASYANWCGSAKGYCLAAPGDSIVSTAATDKGNVEMSGTSMAAGVVSGSVALLNGYYPWLSAQNIAYLLLETANNTGEYANSDKYGRGALDLEAAVTTPVGGLNLPSSASFNDLKSAGSSRLALSAPVQNKLSKALPQTVTAFDGLNRPFAYDTEKMVSKVHASNANLKNSVSRLAVTGSKKTVKDEKTGFSFTSAALMNDGGHEQYGLAEVSHETDSGASRFYYAKNSKYDMAGGDMMPTLNPYLAMNEAYGAENTLNLSNDTKLKLTLQTGENGLYERDSTQDRHAFNERAYAMSGEYSLGLTDYLEVAALGGMLFEDEAVLGMNGRGGFGFQSGTTYYTGVKAALQLTDNFSLLAAYYRGYTQGASSALLAVSDIETESFMLAGEYKVNKKDKLGLSFSSPMTVRKGRASMMYATGRDNYSDTIYMEKIGTSLAPEAREYDVGLYYQGEPKEGLSLSAKAEARFNADGERGLTDYIGMAGVSAAF